MTENKIDKRFKTGLHSLFKYKWNTEFQDQKDYEWDTPAERDKNEHKSCPQIPKRLSCIHEGYLEGKIFAQYT